MIINVSVSDLRNNISQYLERVIHGTRVLIRDERRNITIAQITQTAIFDKEMYDKVLQKASGIFHAKNHPEWSTKAKLKKWISNSRLSDDRKF